MKPKTNPQTDKDYYAYVLVYVDDLLHLNHDQEIFMKELEVVYRLKYGILVPPIRYLGPNVEKVQLEEVSIACSTTIEEYCGAAIDNVGKIIGLDETHHFKVFGTKAGERPFLAPYIPEIDVTKVLDDDLQYCYLQLVGLLIWEIKLGRFYIMIGVSVLYQQQFNPREVQLNALYSIF